MPDINSILSGVILPADSTGLSPVGRQDAANVPSGAVSQDIFIQGQWWANRARGDNGGPADQEGGSGNRLRRDAARAYASQQNSLSGEADPASAESPSQGQTGAKEQSDGAAAAASEDGRATTVTERKADGTPLTDEELRQLAVLKNVDTRVKAHEMAHLAVAGSYARGGASFQYRKGPDGRDYAVGGEVPIDVSRESTPQATINKMQVVRAAALAPADPSPQDRRVATAATATMGEARQQLRLEKLAQMDARAKNAEASGPGNPAVTASEEKSSDTSGAQGGTTGAEKTGRKGLIGRYLAGSTVPAKNNGFATVA